MSEITKTQTALVEGSSALLTSEITMFLLDVSGSMGDQLQKSPIRVSKIEALRQAMLKFVDNRESALRNGASDKVGVILFGCMDGTSVKMLHEPSASISDRLKERITFLSAGGSTPMAGAVEMANKILMGYPDGFLRVVIITDGYPDSRSTTIQLVEESFETYGIVYDAIGLEEEGHSGSVDKDFLEQVTSKGGGQMTLIHTVDELIAKLTQIEEERALLMNHGILLLPENV